MPSTRHSAGALLVLAVLLLTTPLYAHAVLPIDEPKSSKLLSSRPLGEDDDGSAIEESTDLVSTWAGEYVLDVETARERVVENRTSLLECTEAPGGAVDVLDRAVVEGTASTDGDAVGSTLQCFDDRYRYLQVTDGNESAYLEFAARRDDGTTTVTTSPVEAATVADAIRERELVHYGDLDDAEQRTVDRILDSDDSKYGGHQPRPGSPVLEKVPMLLEKDGLRYVLEHYGWVERPNLLRKVVLAVLQAVGLASLLGAAAVVRVGRRGDGGSSDGDDDQR